MALSALAATGCKAGDAAVGLSKDAPQGREGLLEVPEPAADGPKLVAMRPGVAVVERPEPGARKLGELSPGALVARSPEPYGKKGCAGGWYAVRPRGFVCQGEGATLRTELAPLLPAPPALTRPLPYRYGRARTQGTPAYAWMPDAAALSEAEPDLGRWLGRAGDREAEQLGAAANDVPLSERGVPTGPPVLMPAPVGEGVGEDGKRTAGLFFAFAGREAAPLLPLPALAGDLGAKAVALRKGSGVAVTRSFVA
ncbi:MAG TPA: hypothetical protein VLS89_08135, partial [Candidatus Nanopelagicales bacterium]|nr:hypothetical protein [Candidatus Nanopelagicales bacterium]